jgi:16S rRNA (cytidine1402-2'-O)-methyltransferase
MASKILSQTCAKASPSRALNPTDNSPAYGTLFVVATPIGNLQDISQRAQSILSSVYSIVAEDTRHAKHLTQCLGIQTSVLSIHLRNEQAAAERVLTLLKEGHHLALISDAGTPGVSDPGGWVVRAALSEGLSVVPVPGACSATAAWSASGFTETQFLFYGFLPSKSQARRNTLTRLSTHTTPIIFYEAPHRIRDMLNDVFEVFGNRTACIARELTKNYETLSRGELKTLIEYAQNEPNIERGELVVIVEGCPDDTADELDAIALECLQDMLQSNSLVSAVSWVQKLTGLPRDLIYKRALLLKESSLESDI